MSLPVPGPAAPGASAPLRGCPIARLEPMTDRDTKWGSYYLCNKPVAAATEPRASAAANNICPIYARARLAYFLARRG